MKRIYLIDCPGIVYPAPEDTETDIVLKGVVRVENLKTPDEHIGAILQKAKPEYLSKTYGISSWTDDVDFMTLFAKKSGKLLKGGEPDFHTVAKMILNDWLRGKIPYFTAPPFTNNDNNNDQGSSDNNNLQISQQFDSIQVSTKFNKKDLVGNPAELEQDKKILQLETELKIYKNMLNDEWSKRFRI
jgi:nuclear GTP-binding protein